MYVGKGKEALIFASTVLHFLRNLHLYDPSRKETIVNVR